MPQMNLKGIFALVVDNDQFGLALLTSMLRGLGIEHSMVVKTAEAARACLMNNTFDLCICGATLRDASGADLVQWIRRLKPPACYMPILVLTSYSELRSVKAIRDAGAHMVIKKPVSPRVLYDRIAWAAKLPRPFVEAGPYIGPDRRFKLAGSPDGTGRRDDDLPAETGEIVEPNRSQDEIGAIDNPAKATA